ncbi:hypothetical protein L484_015475 [Morus notabilis]|uniref:Uncharacterized protein n=1 Tax=Morus notabilis TaxID=981085 RepID=W9RGY3_9ROSA|nr:hypothetical protein L484_015473 [Morus notabilis]EXB90181.1 hypothetical protein L484_015475 [Morus notabilis]
MQEDLIAPYLAAELKHAVFSMRLWKAPGPDGFHAGVLSIENWDVTNVCLNILNETYIVLILKIKSPRRVSDFCHAIYKNNGK